MARKSEANKTEEVKEVKEVKEEIKSEVEMIVTSPVYNGRRFNVGEDIEVNKEEAEYLERVGAAIRK